MKKDNLGIFLFSMKSALFANACFIKRTWFLTLLVAFNFSCSKDDPEPAVYIKVQDTGVSFTDANNCHVGGGIYYTQFDFTIPYETSPDIEIEKIIYSTAVEGVNTTLPKEKTTFDQDATEINFSLCLKFGNAPYIDFTTSLMSKDGLKSNEKTVRIDRPTNAN